MAATDLDELLTRMETMAKVVNGFSSEAVQLQAFSALVAAFGLRPNQLASSSEERTEAEVPFGDNAPKRQRRTTRRAKSGEKTESPTGLDVNEVVNAVKSHDKFDIFYKKIIVGDASRAAKVKFVSWFVDKPLTSGDMQRVLNALGVKMDAPTASKAVADAQHDLLKDKNGRITLFQLSAKARAEYDTWLMVSGDA